MLTAHTWAHQQAYIDSTHLSTSTGLHRQHPPEHINRLISTAHTWAHQQAYIDSTHLSTLTGLYRQHTSEHINGLISTAHTWAHQQAYIDSTHPSTSTGLYRQNTPEHINRLISTPPSPLNYNIIRLVLIATKHSNERNVPYRHVTQLVPTKRLLVS
jgi:hypothetical protein